VRGNEEIQGNRTEIKKNRAEIREMEKKGEKEEE
jgi:hypothetical protein